MFRLFSFYVLFIQEKKMHIQLVVLLDFLSFIVNSSYFMKTQAHSLTKNCIAWFLFMDCQEKNIKANIR